MENAPDKLDRRSRRKRRQREQEFRHRPFYLRPGLWVFMTLVGIAGTGYAWGTWWWKEFEASLPDTEEIFRFSRRGTVTIKAADGSILQQMGPVTHDEIKINNMPKLLVRAFLAAEDRRFYEHDGVDYKAIARAMRSNFEAREIIEGGSTITQQLTRMVFLTQEMTLERKLKEARLAQKLEGKMSKDEILERYLNLVYLGGGAYGVGDAAWVYFGKEIDELTLPQMATIAGMPAAPSAYSPTVNPDIAKERRDWVLGKMRDAGYISQPEMEAAIASPLGLDLKFPKRLDLRYPYFTTHVRQELEEKLSPEQIEKGGLIVETSLDIDWQNKGQEAIENLVETHGYYEKFEQAALVAIDPKTGEVKAIIGGTGFEESQFNRATQAMRQPGSTFKGFIYSAAIAAGFSPYDNYLDAPLNVEGYQPANANGSYAGWIPLHSALTQSVNVIAVRLLMDVGIGPTVGLAERMGIKSELQTVYSLALGASEVTLLELTNGYATIANQGQFIEAHTIRRVLDRQGNVVYEANTNPQQALDEDSAAIVTWMLQNVVKSGTGRPASLSRPVAGKTGTSDNSRDLWFVGFIPQVTVGIWLGNDDSSPTWSNSGRAAQTWHDFMVQIEDEFSVAQFPTLPDLYARKNSIEAEPEQPGQYTYNASGEGSSGGGNSSGYSSANYNGGDSSAANSYRETYPNGYYYGNSSFSEEDFSKPPAKIDAEPVSEGDVSGYEPAVNSKPRPKQ